MRLAASTVKDRKATVIAPRRIDPSKASPNDQSAGEARASIAGLGPALASGR
jgi:hypothetical protein